MAGIVNISDIKFDEPSGMVALNSIKFDEPKSGRNYPKEINDNLLGLAENALNIGTGIPASMFGMVAGLGTEAYSKLTTGTTDIPLAQNVQGKVSNFLTYQPRSEQGQNIAEQINKPLSILGATPQPIMSVPGNIGKEIIKPVLQSTNAPESIKYPVEMAAELGGYIVGGKALKSVMSKDINLPERLKAKKVIEEVIAPESKIIDIADVKFDTTDKIQPIENIAFDQPVTPEIKVTETPIPEVTPAEIVQPGATSGGKSPILEGTESRLAIRAEADTIAKKLTSDFGDLAEYKTMNMADQANRAAEVMDGDYGKAKRMAMGEELPPPGIREATMFEAVKIRAIKEGDVDTLQKLATESTVPTRLSEYGQAIKAADSRLMDDPVKAMQDVGKARQETSARISGAKAPNPIEVAKLKQAVDTAKTTLNEYIDKKEVDNILKTDNPLKEPKVKYGSRNKLITTTEYETVKAELSKQFGTQLNAGLDPTIAIKLGKIGTYHFEAGVRNFELWSQAVIKDLGEWVKPHLADLWKQTNNTVRADIALRTRKTRLKNETQEFTDKLNNLDFAKKEKRKTILDVEGLKLQAAHETAKKNYQVASEAGGVTKEEATKIVEFSKTTADAKKNFNEVTQEWTSPKDKADYGAARVVYLKYIDSLKTPNITLMEMIRNRASETKVTFKDNSVKAATDLLKDSITAISDISISFVASIDNSFIGRQGMNTLITHPTIWASAAKKSFSDIYNTMASKHGGEAAKDALMADVYSRPNYMNGSYDIAKLIPKTEEQFPTSIPERTPLGVGRMFKASENAFVNTAIRMRINTFDLIQDIAKKNGVGITGKVQIQDMGKLINSVTARGDLGRLGDGGLIRLVLWAPKMLKGNWDVLTAHTGGAGLATPFARQQARINLLKIVASTSAVMAIANAVSPGSVEIDPRSSDFLKIKLGNTRFDISGGKGSIITLLARAITFSTKSTMTGRVTPLNSGKYGAKTVFDVGIDFLVNKTTPAARTTINITKGRDFQGQKPTIGNVAYGLTTPISIQNFVQNFYGPDADGSVSSVVGSVVDLVGINSNTYTQQKKKITNSR